MGGTYSSVVYVGIPGNPWESLGGGVRGTVVRSIVIFNTKNDPTDRGEGSWESKSRSEERSRDQ